MEQKLRSAMWLIKSVDQRQRTLRKVTQSIVKFQRDFLDRGIAHLRPLALRDVGEDIGMHESTISRVTTNKYVETPQGLFELKYFFHSGIAGGDGEMVSSVSVKKMIQDHLATEEAGQAPLGPGDRPVPQGARAHHRAPDGGQVPRGAGHPALPPAAAPAPQVSREAARAVTGISFVVITGLSGAGKSYAIKCFEDMGFFCVDNLPSTLIPTFADLVARSPQPGLPGGPGRRRPGGRVLLAPARAPSRRSRRAATGWRCSSWRRSDESLVRRFHETRRRHPLGDEGRNVLEAIRAERTAMAHLREIADRIIDTSGLTVHQLKARLAELYVAPAARTGLATSLVSFGFKHGLPVDADLVFDVRFLAQSPLRRRACAPSTGATSGCAASWSSRRPPTGSWPACDALLEFVLPVVSARGQGLPHHRHRLHRGPPSLGGPGRGAAPLPDRAGLRRPPWSIATSSVSERGPGPREGSVW